MKVTTKTGKQFVGVFAPTPREMQQLNKAITKMLLDHPRSKWTDSVFAFQNKFINCFKPKI